MAINAMKRPPPASFPREQSQIPIQETAAPTIKNQLLLEGPKYEFGKVYGTEHFLKHTRGVDAKLEPIKNHKPSLPASMTLKQYTEGAKSFFAPKNSNNVASFVGRNGRLYMYSASTNTFGVANPITGKIITYFKPANGIKYWNNQIKNQY